MFGLIALVALVGAAATVAATYRGRLWWLPGAIAMTAGGIAYVALSPGPSDCHGSPICGLDALDAIGAMVVGGGIAVLGVFALVLAWTLRVTLRAAARDAAGLPVATLHRD